MRYTANLESMCTYEGADEVYSLVAGDAAMGYRAFIRRLSCQVPGAAS